MHSERQEYINCIKQLNGDLQGRKKALEFIENSDIYAYGTPAPFPYVPYIFNDADLRFLNHSCTTIHGILCKVIKRYLDDTCYRKLFNYPPELERLIMLPCNYEQMLPMGRFDLFLNEETSEYKFCEFNTDGSGAMSRDFMIASALELGDAHKLFAQKHEVEKFELIDSWVEAFMRIYQGDTGAVQNPTVCITDFEESGVFSDFNRFIDAFKKRGIDARFVDTRAFEFDGKHLIDPKDGAPIHAIFRRAVTSELLQHLDECKALIDAVETEKVCLIGHFRTTVVHSKMVNVMLFDNATKSFLSAEENDFIEKHVPKTFLLNSDNTNVDIDVIKRTHKEWILKPLDDYGSRGVHPGIDYSDSEWSTLVDECLDAGYIIQEFYMPPLVNNIITEHKNGSDPCEVVQLSSMPGYFVYDGKLQGFYGRQGRSGIIAVDHGGYCVSSLHVKS